jgi:hypothetical protein
LVLYSLILVEKQSPAKDETRRPNLSIKEVIKTIQNDEDSKSKSHSTSKSNLIENSIEKKDQIYLNENLLQNLTKDQINLILEEIVTSISNELLKKDITNPLKILPKKDVYHDPFRECNVNSLN